MAFNPDEWLANSSQDSNVGGGTAVAEKPTGAFNPDEWLVKEKENDGTIDGVISRVGREQGFDPDLLRALIHHESGGNPNAHSSAGAHGLTQLMPDTAWSVGVTDIHDPVQQIEGGGRYLKQQLDAHGGSIPLALAAYNAGPGAVKKYGGVPPFKETQDYVDRVQSTYNAIKSRAAMPDRSPDAQPVFQDAWGPEVLHTLGEMLPSEKRHKEDATPAGENYQTSGSSGLPPISKGELAVANIERLSKRYTTPLPPDKVEAFKKWKAINAPKDSGFDYDLPGAFLAGLNRDPVSGHFDDKFKKPIHPTFSKYSNYAKDHPELAGDWNGDTYVPPNTLERARLDEQQKEAEKYWDQEAANQPNMAGRLGRQAANLVADSPLMAPGIAAALIPGGQLVAPGLAFAGPTAGHAFVNDTPIEQAIPEVAKSFALGEATGGAAKLGKIGGAALMAPTELGVSRGAAAALEAAGHGLETGSTLPHTLAAAAAAATLTGAAGLQEGAQGALDTGALLVLLGGLGLAGMRAKRVVKAYRDGGPAAANVAATDLGGPPPFPTEPPPLPYQAPPDHDLPTDTTLAGVGVEPTGPRTADDILSEYHPNPAQLTPAERAEILDAHAENTGEVPVTPNTAPPRPPQLFTGQVQQGLQSLRRPPLMVGTTEIPSDVEDALAATPDMAAAQEVLKAADLPAGEKKARKARSASIERRDRVPIQPTGTAPEGVASDIQRLAQRSAAPQPPQEIPNGQEQGQASPVVEDQGQGRQDVLSGDAGVAAKPEVAPAPTFPPKISHIADRVRSGELSKAKAGPLANKAMPGGGKHLADLLGGKPFDPNYQPSLPDWANPNANAEIAQEQVAKASDVDASHQSLTDAGFELRDTSEAGSRYYHHPDGSAARVSDHAPNPPTRAWMEKNGVEEIYNSQDANRFLKGREATPELSGNPGQLPPKPKGANMDATLSNIADAVATDKPAEGVRGVMHGDKGVTAVKDKDGTWMAQRDGETLSLGHKTKTEALKSGMRENLNPPAPLKRPAKTSDAITETHEGLQAWRQAMKSGGIQPPKKIGGSKLTDTDFGGKLQPGYWRNDGAYSWDTALEQAREYGVHVPNDPDPSVLRDLLHGPTTKTVAEIPRYDPKYSSEALGLIGSYGSEEKALRIAEHQREQYIERLDEDQLKKVDSNPDVIAMNKLIKEFHDAEARKLQSKNRQQSLLDDVDDSMAANPETQAGGGPREADYNQDDLPFRRQQMRGTEPGNPEFNPKRANTGIDPVEALRTLLDKGKSFSKDVYEAAKPHLEALYQTFLDAGKSGMDFVRHISKEIGQHAVSYAKKMVQDYKAAGNRGAAIKPTAAFEAMRTAVGKHMTELAAKGVKDREFISDQGSLKEKMEKEHGVTLNKTDWRKIWMGGKRDTAEIRKAVGEYGPREGQAGFKAGAKDISAKVKAHMAGTASEGMELPKPIADALDRFRNQRETAGRREGVAYGEAKAMTRAEAAQERKNQRTAFSGLRDAIKMAEKYKAVGTKIGATEARADLAMRNNELLDFVKKNLPPSVASKVGKYAEQIIRLKPSVRRDTAMKGIIKSINKMVEAHERKSALDELKAVEKQAAKTKTLSETVRQKIADLVDGIAKKTSRGDTINRWLSVIEASSHDDVGQIPQASILRAKEGLSQNTRENIEKGLRGKVTWGKRTESEGGAEQRGIASRQRVALSTDAEGVHTIKVGKDSYVLPEGTTVTDARARAEEIAYKDSIESQTARQLRIRDTGGDATRDTRETRYADLSTDEIKNLSSTIKTLLHQHETKQHLKMGREQRAIQQTQTDAAVEAQERAGQKVEFEKDMFGNEHPVEKEHGTARAKIANPIARWYRHYTLNPENVVLYMAKEGGKVWDILVKAPIRARTKALEVNKMLHDGLLEAMGKAGLDLRTIQSWGDSVNPYNSMREGGVKVAKESLGVIKPPDEFPVQVGGKTVNLTKMERVMFSLLWRDPDTRYQLMRNQNKGITLGRDVNRVAYKIDAQGARNILGSMTEQERLLANSLHGMFNGKLAQMLREDSLKRNGHDIYGNENYAPRQRDGEELPESYKAKQLAENQSFTRDRGLSDDPFVLNDAFSVVRSHYNRVGLMLGYADAVRDALVLLEPHGKFAKTVTSIYDHGGQTIDMIRNRIEDQGMLRNIQSDLSNAWAAKFARGHAAANLSLNIPVIISQSYSVMAIQADVGWKNLMEGTAAYKKADKAKLYEEINRESPDGWHILHGTGMTHLDPESAKGDLLHELGQKSPQDKLMSSIEWGNHPAVAITWEAVKAEGRRKGLSGDALMAYAKERFPEVYNRSQPNDNAMYQSGAKLAGKTQTFWRIASMYTSQTQAAANQAIRAVIQYQHGDISKGKAAHDVFQSLVVQQAMFIGTKVAYGAGTALIIKELSKALGIQPKKEEDRKEWWSKVVGKLVGSSVGMFPGGVGTAAEAATDLITHAIAGSNFSPFDGVDENAFSQFADTWYRAGEELVLAVNHARNGKKAGEKITPRQHLLRALDKALDGMAPLVGPIGPIKGAIETGWGLMQQPPSTTGRRSSRSTRTERAATR